MDFQHADRQVDGERIRYLPPERTVATLLLSVVLILGLGLLREDYISGMSRDAFFVMKTDWQKNTDVVLAGDSRVFCGIAPEELEASLSGLRVLNFGFSAGAYSEDYLQAVEDLLSDNGKQKVIVFNIAPWAFAQGAIESNGFRKYHLKPPNERFMIRHFEAVYGFFEPIDYTIGFSGVTVSLGRGEDARRYYRHYREDGWAASYCIPEDPPSLAVRLFAPEYKKSGSVSEEAMRGFIEKVGAWTDEGIAVFGLRMPTFAGRDRIEDNLLNFDQEALVDRFVGAGGIWLEFDADGYHTYDGSHLHRDEASRFSAELGRRISSRIERFTETGLSE